MSKFNRSWIVILAWLAAGLAAHPAWAQSDESRQLSREIAHKVLSAIPSDGLAESASASLNFLATDFPQRPEWKGFFIEALVEEFDADRPLIEQIVGDAIAQQVTVEELRVGIVMFRGAAGDDVARIIGATIRHQKAPQPGPEMDTAVRQLAADPAGRRFADKLGQMDKLLKGTTNDVVVALIPGMMRRFGEKAEVAERARRGVSRP